MNFLYRVYDRKNRLLYVGKSTNAIRRMSEHAHYSRWFRRAVTIRIEKISKSINIFAHEMNIIREENPLYNKSRHDPDGKFLIRKVNHRFVRIPIGEETPEYRCFTIEEALAFYQTKYKLAQALGIHRSNLTRWKHGKIPFNKCWELHKLTNGALRFEPAARFYAEEPHDPALS